MTARDKYRAAVYVVLVVLGTIVLVRSALDPTSWPIAIFGALLLGLGLYRLNQIRVYLQSVRS